MHKLEYYTTLYIHFSFTSCILSVNTFFTCFLQNSRDDSKNEEDLYPRMKPYVPSTPSSADSLTIKLISKPRSTGAASAATPTNPKRLTLASPSDFEGLVEASQRSYGLPETEFPTFYYIDDEGDEIDISSPQELRAAFSYFASAQTSSAYKLFVDLTRVRKYRPYASSASRSQSQTSPLDSSYRSTSPRKGEKSDQKYDTGASAAATNIPFLGAADSFVGLIQRALRSETLLPQLLRSASSQLSSGANAESILTSMTDQMLKVEPKHDPQLTAMAQHFAQSLGQKLNGPLQKHREGVAATLKSATRLANDPTLFPKFQRVMSRCVGDILTPAIVSYTQGMASGSVNPITHFAGPVQQIIGVLISEPDVLALVLEMAPHFAYLGGMIKNIVSKFTGGSGSSEIGRLVSLISGVATGTTRDPVTGQSQPSQTANTIASALSSVLPLVNSYVSRVQGTSGGATTGTQTSSHGILDSLGGAGGAAGLAGLASSVGNLFSNNSRQDEESGVIDADADGQPSHSSREGGSSLASGLSTLATVASGLQALNRYTSSQGENRTESSQNSSRRGSEGDSADGTAALSNVANSALRNLKDSFLSGLNNDQDKKQQH